MTQISRLRNAEIANGNLINADDIAAELNQLVSESNTQDNRLTTIESGTQTLSGNKTLSGNSTFSGTATFNNSATFTGAVTLSGTIALSGQTSLARASDPGTPNNGDFWYNSTGNVFKGQVNGSTRTLATTSDILTRGFIAGLALANNVSDASNDIDIAQGSCRDATNAMNLVLAATLTKQSDAAWAAGSNAGGMDTGSKPSNGTLHIWLIKRSDTGVVDALFSTSVTSPTMPANYDYKRRIGAVRTDGSGNILGFVQYGDTFLYTTVPALDVDVTNQGTSAVTRTLSVPAGIVVKALLNVVFANGSASQASIYIKSPDVSDMAPSSTVTPLGTFITENNSATADYSGGTLEVYTNTSGQVTSRATTTGLILRIATRGWIDRRGRDD